MAALIVEGSEPRRSRGGLEVLIDLNLGGAAAEALWLSNFLSIHQPPRDAPNGQPPASAIDAATRRYVIPYRDTRLGWWT